MNKNTIILIKNFYFITNKPIASCGVNVGSFPNINTVPIKIQKELEKQNYNILTPSPWQKFLGFFNKKYDAKNALVTIEGTLDGTAWKSERVEGGELWTSIIVKNTKTKTDFNIEETILHTTNINTIIPQLIAKVCPQIIEAIEKLEN